MSYLASSCDSSILGNGSKCYSVLWHLYTYSQLPIHSSVSTILQSRRHCWQSVGRRRARYPGGEEARLVHLEQLQLQSDLPYGPNSTEDSTLVVPLYHMWMRLHSIEPNSTVSNPLYSIYRLRLEQQSLQQNLCRVVSILWNRCFLKFCRGPQFVDAITQTGNPQLTTAIKKRNWLQNLVFGFLSVGIKKWSFTAAYSV